MQQCHYDTFYNTKSYTVNTILEI